MNLLYRFKDYLFSQEGIKSKITIKNYLSDIRRFIKWYGENYNRDLEPTGITQEIIESYKTSSDLSGRSFNRHLSSLRKFIGFLNSEGITKLDPLEVAPIRKITNRQNDAYGIKSFKDYLYLSNASPLTIKNYIIDVEKFISWAERVTKIKGTWDLKDVDVLGNINIDLVEEYKNRLIERRFLPSTVNRKLSSLRKYIIWLINQGLLPPNSYYNLKDKSDFDENQSLKGISIPNIKKEFYAPLAISTKYLPWRRKLFHYLYHKRPKWYVKYHSYSMVHYLHLAILIIFASALGFSIYQSLFLPSNFQTSANTSPTGSRVLPFSGKLTNLYGDPITKTSDVRFSIYSDPVASNSSLLWQEVDKISPSENGDFSTRLGQINPIPQSLFLDNPSLWLGITIGPTPELSPRQQLANVDLANNSQSLQGLLPISDTSKGVLTSNAILALDSSGNLSIGGSASPTFQATGGEFTISGNILSLTTVLGSNSDVRIIPDGLGKIDLNKPLQNTTNNNNIPSAVGSLEIDDLLSILATSSGQSAFTVNQNDTGPLISASRSGFAKFTVDGSGNTIIQGNLGIGNPQPTSSLDISGGGTFQGSGVSAINVEAGNITLSSPIPGVSQTFRAVSIGGPNLIGATPGQIVNTASTLYVDSPTAGTNTTINNLKPIDTATGAFLSIGGVWTNASNSNLKTNFTPVNTQSILDKINQLPITEWSYKVQSQNIKHIGPTAQDFYGIFGLGENNTSISTIDPSGIALVGIQALSSQVAYLSGIVGKIQIKPTDNPSISPSGVSGLENIINQAFEFSQATIANLKVGMVDAKEITAGSLTIASSNLKIAGESLAAYIVEVASNNGFIQQDTKIISPLGQINTIRTNFISPLSSSKLVIRLDSGTSQGSTSSSPLRPSLEIQNSSGSAVAAIDSEGNASLSGSLAANGASISGSFLANAATISGTLRAGKIIAGQIEGPETQTSATGGLSSNVSTQSSNLYFRDLNADTATFNQGIIAFGPASFYDISAASQLSVGSSLILADNSINVLGSDLRLQPLKQGNISIMDGLIYIDTKGDLGVSGNANFAKDVNINGVLSANILSPIPNSDLVIRPGDANLSVQNSSGSSVLSINQTGDLTSSGTATFSKINLTASSPVILSKTQVLATGSAGTATISAHYNKLTIYNKLVTEKSLIYITPRGNNQNIVLSLIDQVPGVSFSVGTNQSAIQNTSFNWLIVN